jgi:hypothetical protein
MNNEIFLLVGDVLSAILAHPDLLSEYTDFTMVPWWTVATLPLVNQPMGFTEASTLDSSCKSLCEESASLLNQALKLQGVETALVTPLFIAQVIGAFEQNSIGIRARHPLCRDILENPRLRLEQHQNVIRCLEKAGFVGGEGCVDDDCDDDCATDFTEDVDLDVGGDQEVMSEVYESESKEEVTDEEEQGLYSVDEIAEYLAGLDIDERETEDDLDAIFTPLDGTAMFSITCKMNHSCDANVVIVYRGLQWDEPLVAQCIAKRDIAEGEELCISYIDANQPIEVRQRDLANYGFSCNCERCRAERGEMLLHEDDAASDDMEMSKGDDDDVVEIDGDLAQDERNRGEDLLHEKLEEIKTAADLSPHGSIPSAVLSEAQSFIVELGSNALTSLDPSTEIAHDLVTCIAASKLGQFCVCAKTGDKLQSYLHQLMQENGFWRTPVHRDAFWVAVVVASVGMAHTGSFLRAQELLDKAVILGLERSLVKTFFRFVERHSNEMHEGPLVARSITGVIAAHSSDFYSCGLSKSISLAIPEISGAFNVIMHNSEAKPIVVRGLAAKWEATSKWR